MIGKIVPKLTRATQTIVESSDLFLNHLTTTYPTKSILITLTIFIISFTVFSSFTPNALINGDAAVYVQQMEEQNFSPRSIHLGYYLLGYLAIKALPLPSDHAVNILNGFLGALSVALMYLMAYTIIGTHTTAILASVFLLTNSIFVINSVYAEVYVPRTFFLLTATYFWLLNRPLITATSLAFSFLISPSSIFALPLFVAIRPRWKPLLKFGITILMIVIIALLPRYNDYLFGGRGLLRATGEPVALRMATDKEYREVYEGFFLYIPFILAGIVRIWTAKHLRSLGIGILALWFFSFIIGERFGDVPVQLPTYALLCLVGGLGLHVFLTISHIRKTAIYLWFPLSVSLLMLFWAIIAMPNYQAVSFTTTMKLVAFAGTILLYAVLVVLWTKATCANNRAVAIATFGVLTLVASTNAYRTYHHIAQINPKLIACRDTDIEISRIADPNYLVVGGWGAGILFEHYIFRDSYTGRWLNAGLLSRQGGRSKTQCEEAIKKWEQALAAKREIWLLEDLPNLVNELHEHGYAIEKFRTALRATPHSS